MGRSKSKPEFHRKGYHHGNLKEALILAAKQLILEKGPHGFSLVEAARLAKVSPAAPYRHFKDRQALLIEVGRRGYERFANLLEMGWDEGRPNWREALRRMGRAYIDFACQDRAFYRVMFEAGLQGESDPELKEAANRAFRVLSQAAEFVKRESSLEAGSTDMISLHIWAMSHGVATLFGHQTARGGSYVDPVVLLESGMDLYLAGLRANEHSDADDS